MTEPFTERGKLVLTLATDIARYFHHELIHPEHILLGLIRACEKTSTTWVFYSAAWVPIATMKAQLKRALDALPQASTVGEPGFTAQARRVLELGIEAGREVGDDGIGIRHLLFGLIRDEQSTGPSVPDTSTILTFLGWTVGEIPPLVFDVPPSGAASA